MAVDQVSAHRLCEDVGGVPLAGPDPPDAGAAADTDGCAAVRADFKGGGEPEVLGDGRQAQPLCR
eukprot:9489406-Alexandrium_andersonii.AAC.1